MTAKEWVQIYETEGKEAAFDILAGIAKPYEPYGVRVSLMIAQFLQESFKGGGQWSGLFLNQNNMHGIKSDKGALLPTQEEVNGELIDLNSTFAVYASIEDAILAYIKLMCGSRYFEVRAAETWQQSVVELNRSPYATASHYGKAVKYWVEKYELYRYDTYVFYDRREEVFNTTRFRDRGGRVFRVQMLLMEVGYDIQPNSIYDLVTFGMVKDFQTKTKLLVDGVCGINTFLMLQDMVLALNTETQVKQDEPIEEVEVDNTPRFVADYFRFLDDRKKESEER